MSETIRILFLSANPDNITQLRLDREVRMVDQTIRLGKFRDHLSLLPHFAVTPDDLRETLLRHKPHVLHFSGHGSPVDGIVLKDDTGKVKFVHPDALAELLNVIQDNVRIVVLNACFSAQQHREIKKVVDFTIGMRNTIRDSSAIVFSAGFYQGLAYGRSVQEAFGLGVNAIRLAGIPEADIPVLLCKRRVDPAQVHLIRP